MIHPANASPITELLHDARLGFNGERLEPVSGHYLLGIGYRSYNPVTMRFNAPDTHSPFGDGGLNAYAYCLGDPVNQVDPDGHVPFAALKLYVSKFTGFKMKALTQTSAGIMTPKYWDPDLPSGQVSMTSLLSDDGLPLAGMSKHTYRSLRGEGNKPVAPAPVAKKAPDPEQPHPLAVVELPELMPQTSTKVSTVAAASQVVERNRPGKVSRLRKYLERNANRVLRAGFANGSPIIPPRF